MRQGSEQVGERVCALELTVDPSNLAVVSRDISDGG